MDESKTIMQEYEENPKLDTSPDIKEEFSKIAAEFAAETDKTATQTPEAMKAENLPEDQQMEFNSRFFKMYNVQFCNLMDQLPKKSVARVVKRLVSYPLETPSEMTWTSEKEKNAFLIGNQLIEVKYLMFKYVMSEQIAKETMEKLKADTQSNKLPGSENLTKEDISEALEWAKKETKGVTNGQD